jgi:hypothetical protein
MRCRNRARRISALSERGQSCSNWSPPFAESVPCKTAGQISQALCTVPGANILHVLLALPCPAAHLHRTACVGCIPPRRSCGPLGVGCPQKSWRGPRCRMISEEPDSSWHMRYLAPQIPSSTSFPSSRLPLHSSSTFTTFDDPAVLPRRGLLSALYPQSHPSRSIVLPPALSLQSFVTTPALRTVAHLFLSRSRKQSFSPPRSHGGNGCDRHVLRSIR